MLYITSKERKLYDDDINQILTTFDLHQSFITIAGHFTYVVYRLLKWFNCRFWTRALGIGCLVCAILEIYRRDHAEYEDEKIQENGDIK